MHVQSCCFANLNLLLFCRSCCRHRKHGISFRYTFTLKYRKTSFLTNLKSKIKTKIIKMKRKHLLFKEAVCKNRKSLIKLFYLSFLLHSRIGRWLAFWTPSPLVQLITLLEEPELKSILSCLFVGLQDKASRRQGSKARTIPAIWCPRNTRGEWCGSCKARR